MTRLLGATIVGIFALLAAVIVRAQDLPPARKIPFAGAVRIVDALRPGDRVVTLDAPGRFDSAETFPKTVDEELFELSNQEEVVVFEVQEVRSSLTDNGTWVRTRVMALVERALRHFSRIPWGDPFQLVLEFDNGEIELQGVIVKAGRYPVFERGSRYLGVLSYDSSIKGWNTVKAFRIGADGTLVRLNNWDGSAAWLSGSLEGLSLETVIKRLDNK